MMSLALVRKARLSVPMWEGPGESNCNRPPAISALVELPNLPSRMPASPIPPARQGGMAMTLLMESSSEVTACVGQGLQAAKDAVEKNPELGWVQLPSVHPLGVDGAASLHLLALRIQGASACDKK